MDQDTLTEVELALSITKRVEREARIAKQTLGRLRDRLQSEMEDTRNNEHTSKA